MAETVYISSEWCYTTEGGKYGYGEDALYKEISNQNGTG